MKNLVIIFVSLFIVVSCSEKAPIETTVGDGDVLLSFNKSEIPDSVFLIEVILSREGFDRITEKLNPQNDSNAEVYFKEVAAGNWTLKVNAYSVDNILLYTGEALVSVEANTTTPVFLQLKYVDGHTTGSVYVYITWETSVDNRWFDYPANPILEKLDNSNDYKGVAGSFVLKEPTGYKMWFTGLSGGGSHIYSAVSQDGLNWKRVGTLPVISPGNFGEWDNRNVSAGPVIRKDGLYLMYYGGRSTAEIESSPWHIGLAVSRDGIHWEKRPEPILSGTIGGWDLKIGPSDIEIIDGIYYLYYTGKTQLNDHQIGLAHSRDGINWVRYSNNPIFSEAQSWEGAGYYNASVYKENNTYHMVYMNSDPYISGFGYAVSNDGIEWSKLDSNPFITSDETYNKWERIIYPNILDLENELRIYYTGYNISQDERAICVLRKFKH